MIRTCIKYDGELYNKFNTFVEKYADVIIVNLGIEPPRHNIEGVDIPSDFYFDVKVDGTVYDVIAVGDYGYGISPYIVPSILPNNVSVYNITDITDINTFKMPDVGHNGDTYSARIVPEDISLSEMLEGRVELNKDRLYSSLLCELCMDYRERMCQALNVLPADIFTMKQLYEFYAGFPGEPVPASPLSVQTQKDLIEIWDNYDSRN